MTFEELEKKVIEWADDRDLFKHSVDIDQYYKLGEEFNELGRALWGFHLTSTEEEFLKIKDGIGDMLVVLTMIAGLNGTTLSECYELAYNQIKDRKGKMINGIFVKEEK